MKGAGSGGGENCVVNLLKTKWGEEDAPGSVVWGGTGIKEGLLVPFLTLPCLVFHMGGQSSLCEWDKDDGVEGVRMESRRWNPRARGGLTFDAAGI